MEDIFEELAAVGSDDEGREEENNQGGSGNRDDEAEEANDTKRVIKPKRVISRPRPKLDPARLLGPRGIFTIKSSFDNIKFKGKGHELDDLNNVLSRLQHWAHRLFPKMTFEDCIERIEELGNKKEIQTNMHKIRNGMIDQDSGQRSQDDDVADNDRVATPSPDNNAFDQLMAAAPAAPQTTLTDEQRARMMRNRLLAEERRMARRLAREKELEELRQAANKATEVSGNITADGSANIVASNGSVSADTVFIPTLDTHISCDSSALQSAGASTMSEEIPSCVLDDPAPDPNTTQDLSLNKESRNSALVQNGAVDQSSAGSTESTVVAGGEEESREYPDTVVEKWTAAVDSALATSGGEETGIPCNDTPSYAHIPAPVPSGSTIQQDSSVALLESVSGSPIVDGTSSPVAKQEARALCSDSLSKAYVGQITSQSDNPLAEYVPPELRLNVSESDLMDVEHTLVPSISNTKQGSSGKAEDCTFQSSIAANKISTGQSETPTPVSVVDELMDVGSAEDWGEAFAEEECALASQNQP